mgnify:CR=1 FL=1
MGKAACKVVEKDVNDVDIVPPVTLEAVQGWRRCACVTQVSSGACFLMVCLFVFMQYICNFVLVQYYCLKIKKFLVSSNVLQFCYLSYFSIIRNLMLTSEPKDHNLSVSKLQAVELMFLFIESF